jgi:NAD(P)H-binding
MRSSARWGRYLRRKEIGVDASLASRFARWEPRTFWPPCHQAGADSSLRAVSVGESYHTGSFGAGFLVKLALKEVMADKEEQEAAVRESDCDWTIVRPATLTFKRARRNLKAGTDLRWNITSTATRADVAEYMVKILDDPATYKKAITVRN